MTVKQLIENLKSLRQDIEVTTYCKNCGHDGTLEKVVQTRDNEGVEVSLF